MPTTREQTIDRLAARQASDLKQVLTLAGVGHGNATTPRDLARRITRQLWWSYATPLGLSARSIPLDEIVDHVATRLQIEGALPQGTVWERLTAMTALLIRADQTGVALDDLDPQTRGRLVRSWWPTVGLATGAGSGFGALGAGRGVLWIASTRVGRLLPYIPSVGTWARSVYKAGGLAAALGGPVGVALSLLAANDALGTNYPKLVPLLLGVGSLGPDPVIDAVEVAQ